MSNDPTTGEANKRTNLGRGLAALFGEETEEYSTLDEVRATKAVPIEHLHPNKTQPRRTYDNAALDALAQSIEANGILQPILVRRHPDHPSEFEIVAGERRWRAAQAARLHEVPVVIRDLTDGEALELALVENVQREDLSPIEEAEGYRRLIEDFHHTQDHLAKTIGKSRSHVANTMRLLNLPDAVKELLDQGALSAGHARALLGAPDPAAMARTIMARDLNVRQTERLVRAASGRGKEPPAPASAAAPRRAGPAVPGAKDSDTVALERDLTALLGLKVTIAFAGEGGSLTIHYQTLEQLDDVLRRLNQAPAQGAA